MSSGRTGPATSSGEQGARRAPREQPAIIRGSNGLLVGVRVSPSAPRTAMRGVYGERLKVAVNAPPEANRANQQLAEALADWLELRRDDVRIQSGHGSRDKMVAFTGIEEAELRSRLERLTGGDLPGRGERHG